MTWSLKKTKQRKSSAPCCSKARKVLLLMRAVGRGGKVWKWSLEGRFHGGRLGCSRANPSRRRCGATEVAPHATPHLKRGNKSKLQTRCWRCTSDSLPVLCSHLFFFGWSVFNCPCCVCVCVCVWVRVKMEDKQSVVVVAECQGETNPCDNSVEQFMQGPLVAWVSHFSLLATCKSIGCWKLEAEVNFFVECLFAFEMCAGKVTFKLLYCIVIAVKMIFVFRLGPACLYRRLISDIYSFFHRDLFEMHEVGWGCLEARPSRVNFEVDFESQSPVSPWIGRGVRLNAEFPSGGEWGMGGPADGRWRWNRRGRRTGKTHFDWFGLIGFRCAHSARRIPDWITRNWWMEPSWTTSCRACKSQLFATSR